MVVGPVRPMAAFRPFFDRQHVEPSIERGLSSNYSMMHQSYFMHDFMLPGSHGVDGVHGDVLTVQRWYRKSEEKGEKIEIHSDGWIDLHKSGSCTRYKLMPRDLHLVNYALGFNFLGKFTYGPYAGP